MFPLLAFTSILFIIASMFLSIDKPARDKLSFALVPDEIRGKLKAAIIFKFDEFTRETLTFEMSVGRLFVISKNK